MTDLVKRLRKVESSRPDSVGISTCWHRNPEGPEAADRIEQLETALRGLLEDTQHRDHKCGDEDCPVRLARAALGETTEFNCANWETSND